VDIPGSPNSWYREAINDKVGVQNQLAPVVFSLLGLVWLGEFTNPAQCSLNYV